MSTHVRFHEWPHQSHTYGFRDQKFRQEFEKVKKEKLIFERKCEQLQRMLRYTQDKETATRKVCQELKRLNAKLIEQKKGKIWRWDKVFTFCC